MMNLTEFIRNANFFSREVRREHLKYIYSVYLENIVSCTVFKFDINFGFNVILTVLTISQGEGMLESSGTLPAVPGHRCNGRTQNA